MLAEAYRDEEQREAGLVALAEAFEVVDKTGAYFSEAELYRLKGELSLPADSRGRGPKGRQRAVLCSTAEAEAEACFQHAIALARCQSAKLFELRATMSLSRLWQQQGKKAEARKVLAEIYGWFTEGFDTADLRNARALLEELGD